MTSAGTVTVDVAGRDVNLVALLTRLEAQMKRTDQVGIQLSQTTGGTFTAAQQRAANAAITEAQAIARAALAAGDDATAHRVLVQALGQSAAASDRSVASLTTQISRLESGTTTAKQFGDAMKSGLLGIVGPTAVAGAAFGALRGTIDSFVAAFNFKTQLDATTASINSQLSGVRNVSQVWTEAAATARTYRLTQADTTAILASSVDVLRNSKSSVSDLEVALLRLQSRDPSKPISEAARALRELNAGDVTTIKELFNIGAADALKMKNEIQGGADAVQVLTAFLDKAGSGMNILEQRTTGALGAMNDLKRAQEDLTLAQAQFAQGPGMAILQARIETTRGATRLLSGDTQAMGQSLVAAGQQGAAAYSGLIAALGPLGPLVDDAALAAGQQQQQQVAQAQAAQQAAAASQNLGITMDAERQAAAAASEAHVVAALTMDAERQAAATTSDAILALRAATEGHTTSLVENITQQQASQLASQQLADVQNLLAQLGGNVAAGLQTAGNAALILSNQYNIAYGAALNLINAQAELARINNSQIFGKATQVIGSVGVLQSQTQATQQAAEAEARYQQTLGNTRPALALARAELAKTTRGTAEYYNALNRVAQLERQGARGGRGAGAARLSDQQKLNNTLLSDQERYQDQAENAERAHQQKLLDIDAEFNRKSLEQQRQNEVSKRQSRADFYDKLTTDTKDIGPQIAQGLSAAYEAAYAQAQAIAQAGNQKLADDYLKMKQRQISAEEDFQKRLADARKNKDRDEVARLEAIHKLQQDANAEEEKQLLAGGDANVKARDEALAAEQRSFEEQQGKIATSAEQAAQRKIDAAQRSGKAVTDENVQLLEQEKILNRIGRPAASGAPVAPGATGGAAGTAPTQAASTPTANLDTLAAALDSIVAAIADAKGAITAAQRDTTGAVKGLSGRVMG